MGYWQGFDIQAVVNKWQLCDWCQTKENLNWKCIVCKEILCDGCKSRHSEGKKLCHHKVLAKSEIHLEPDMIAAFMCGNHEQEEFIMFCQKDNVPICRLCMIDEHQGHSIVKIADAADSMREEINVEMRNTDDKLDKEQLSHQKEMSKVRSEVAGFLDDVESTITSDNLDRKSRLQSLRERVRYMLDLELIHEKKSIRKEAAKTSEATQPEIYNEYVYDFS